ncbi:MAG: glycosyltransferase family 4 protein [Pseudomonadota bacterium]
MRIAYLTPMKPPDHPVPSGDRTFARLIARALTEGGHDVLKPSTLRTFCAEPHALDAILRDAPAARDAIATIGAPPDAILTYHNYHKAPDVIGPTLAAHFDVPYAIVEPSRAPKHQTGPWHAGFAAADAALRAAHALGVVTPRDRPALTAFAPEKVCPVPPFIDTAPFAGPAGARTGTRLFCAAMLRPGRKADSVRLLATAFESVRAARPDVRLTLAGDGPARAALEPLFPPGTLIGLLPPDALGKAMRAHDLFVWPALGEPFGFTFLEAAAAGLPAVAGASPGVAAVVEDGVSGVMVPEGDAPAFAAAVLDLLADPARRAALSAGAAAFARTRDLEAGRASLEALLAHAAHRHRG